MNGGMRPERYKPKSEDLQEVRRRISERSWLKRVSDARRRERVVKKVIEYVASGESRNAAIAAAAPDSKRSATLRDLLKHEDEGFEGLIDRRTPRDPEIPISIQDAIEVARMANPSISVKEVEKILQQKYEDSPSSTSIKRIWKDAGLERRPGRPGAHDQAKGAEASVEVEPLEAAGFQLIRAGEAETEAVGRLVDTVMAVADELPEPGPVPASELKRALTVGVQTGPVYDAAVTLLLAA